MNYLNIFFPMLMVIGALGSLIANLVSKGSVAISLQWLGASLLYLGLTMRNIGG